MSTANKITLESQLWSAADALRGQMDASDYSQYTLGLIFYKYLSEMSELVAHEEADDEDEDKSYSELFAMEKYAEEDGLKEAILERQGYFIEPQHTYAALASKAAKGVSQGWSVDDLAKAFNSLGGSNIESKARETFEGLFDEINLHSNKLGNNPIDRAKVLGNLVLAINKIDFQLDKQDELAAQDILGDAYEYLIGQFAGGAGKKGGEFYTPQVASTIVARILRHECPEMRKVYDPTCGSGSLLLRIAREDQKLNETVDERGNVISESLISLYGQERNATTYNLARMNMILHKVRWEQFHLANGDTLTQDLFPKEHFDAIGANPPYSLVWEHTDLAKRDPRFAAAGKLAPKNAADYAFVQHIIHHLHPEHGVAAVVLPHGVLFRGGAEGHIRQHILKNNLVHAVIGLPENMFYGTSIATCILVLKRGRREDEGVLFLDASQEFVKGKNQNTMSDEHIKHLLSVYEARKGEERYARVVPRSEIVENEYNLNIPRYVDTRPEQEAIDLEAVQARIQRLMEERNALDEKIASWVSQLHPYTPPQADEEAPVWEEATGVDENEGEDTVPPASPAPVPLAETADSGELRSLFD